MKRTTITLPEELAAALEREARRRGVAVSQVAREAIQARLGTEPGKPRRLPFIGLGASGYRTTAQDAEEILRDAWSRDRDR